MLGNNEQAWIMEDMTGAELWKGRVVQEKQVSENNVMAAFYFVFCLQVIQ